MARRVKRAESKLWRNIRFRVTWIKLKWTGATKTSGTDTYDSAEFFPRASTNDLLHGMHLWGLDDKYDWDIEFLEFQDQSDVWPADGGHEWRRDRPIVGACPGDPNWVKCKRCGAIGQNHTDADLIVRCTGEKVCPVWRAKANGIGYN